MKLACYWWNGIRNFGDQLAPYLVERITGHTSMWTSEFSPRLLTVGSILTHAMKHNVVWGSALMDRNQIIPMPLDVRMVRGPFTAKYLADHYSVDVKVFGDPALLVPEYYEPKISKCRGVTVIPHYLDPKQYQGDRILDITMDVFQLIDAIASSERIITSALHPLIIAESYGVPVVAVKNNSDPAWYETQQFKFREYYASTGRKDYSVDHPEYDDCLQHFSQIPKPVFPDKKRMLDAFPWDRLEALRIPEGESINRQS